MARKLAAKGHDSRTKSEAMALLNSRASHYPVEARVRERLAKLIEYDLDFWYGTMKAFMQERELTEVEMDFALKKRKPVVIRDTTAGPRGALLMKILDKFLPDKKESYVAQESDNRGQMAIFHFGDNVNRGTQEARERAVEHKESLREIETTATDVTEPQRITDFPDIG